MAAEVTMIVIDNSLYVPKDSDMFKTQVDAIKLYCLAKTKSNPKNSVGATLVGYGTTEFLYRPTSIENFLAHTLEHIPEGGENDLQSAIQHAMLGLIGLPEDMKKRMLVFVGASAYMKDILERIGKYFNGTNVALDVVSFADDDREFDKKKTESLEAFVAAADKDNNSHFAHVSCHKSSARKILVRSNILSSSEAEAVPLTEEEINKRMNKNKWKMINKKMKKMNKKKNHHSEVLEKHSQDLEKSYS